MRIALLIVLALVLSSAPASAARDILRAGAPAEAGMVQGPLEEIDPFIQGQIREKTMPGAVVLVARHGRIVKAQAYGYAARYADARFTPLERPVPMSPSTIFDIASVSKLFTATAVMQLYDQGCIRLDDPVAKHLPEFAAAGKESVTIRQLLTHTSGFASWLPLHKQGANREERIREVLRHPLEGGPGKQYRYSDLNLIVLGALVERLSGQRLDAYVRAHITEPLGLQDTMYNPPAELKPRIAATEDQPGRRLVWGQVHDENAWSLDGVAGHAGVFSTARDLAAFAQMMLNGGTYRGVCVLSEDAVQLMGENQLLEFPGDDHGLGWELNQGWYMDALAEPNSLGHTGFTGTSLVVSPANETICIVLTNRVHPTRETPSINPVRRGVARQVALAIPVAMPSREGAWFAGMGDGLQNTLTAEVKLPRGGKLRFNTWNRIEAGQDYGYVEASGDGVLWMPVMESFTADSNWHPVTCDLPPGTRYVRFRYSTNDTVNGRGWYVHAPRVAGQDAAWVPSGWYRSTT